MKKFLSHIIFIVSIISELFFAVWTIWFIFDCNAVVNLIQTSSFARFAIGVSLLKLISNCN